VTTPLPAITATIPVGANPDAVAVSPDGQHLYVANAASDAVAVINTATKHVTTSVSVAGGPSGIAVSPNCQHLYVARPGSDAASVIDTATTTSPPLFRSGTIRTIWRSAPTAPPYMSPTTPPPR
jgi:YVTN family beta-propeller protein